MPSTFGNLTYETIFQPFSPVRVFSATASNITDVTFFVPGTPSTAATRAFGAVFTDVDEQGGGASGPYTPYTREASTVVEYYGVDGGLMFRSAVPASAGNAGVSFFGAVFDAARIGSVRLVAGNIAPGPFDENGEDVVMMDDFVYSEPQAAAVAAPARRRR